MIRFIILRVIPLLLLFWLLRGVLRAVSAWLNSQAVAKTPGPGPAVHTGGELKKDPVCGTFVSVDASVTKRVNGETVHFCYAACRDKYRAA